MSHLHGHPGGRFPGSRSPFLSPGPAATMDDMPVPFKPYKEEYDKLNRKFNMLLLAGVSVLGAGLYLVGKYFLFLIF